MVGMIIPFSQKNLKLKQSNFKNTFWFDRRLNRNFSDKELTRQTTQKLDKALSTITNDVIVSLHFCATSPIYLATRAF